MRVLCAAALVVLSGLAGCAPGPELRVFCEAVHADGRDYGCAARIDHSSIFPVRWRLEVDANVGGLPAFVEALEVRAPVGSACEPGAPTCAFGRCTVPLTQRDHGVCAVALRATTDDGPAERCFVGIRAPDQPTFDRYVGSPLRHCDDLVTRGL